MKDCTSNEINIRIWIHFVHVPCPRFVSTNEVKLIKYFPIVLTFIRTRHSRITLEMKECLSQVCHFLV